MPDQPDRQAEYEKACEADSRARVDLTVGIQHIEDVCGRLQIQQRQASLILQHAATSLTVVNPTATEAILNTMHFADRAVKAIHQHTADLSKAVAAIPLPPPPPPPSPKIGGDPSLRKLVEQVVIKRVRDHAIQHADDFIAINSATRPAAELRSYTESEYWDESIMISAGLSIDYVNRTNYFRDGDGSPRSIRQIVDHLIAIIGAQLDAPESALPTDEPAPPASAESQAQPVPESPIPDP